jgi:hypothetical protein
MNTTISPRAISKLARKLFVMDYHYGVPMKEINQATSCPAIREILGNHDVTGRLAAQIRQALLQGVI